MTKHKGKLILLAIFIGFSSAITSGQGTGSEVLSQFVSVRAINQKPAPPYKGKLAPDLIVVNPDDLQIEFEIKNNCRITIYYLAYAFPETKKAAAGFFLYRKDPTADWIARSPEWRRERSLTDPFIYEWLPICPGQSIPFEYSDITLNKRERSFAAYVNHIPKHENRIEVMAAPFSIK